ncbi:hypothetical protein BDY17DRAFT_310816 [Neohortaea acidophila]|uniref:Uncharacterized protein n=1 Tax=Neohortaea acidophila TaxID=245834 RepID=A0A6A6PR68_9PEZI|nr:uncharacterized protein BDY17DRAFT_310816 [Neohortaea acidophila]KAF2482296.1 hypothetical protein BDY17DRAFT_310816 [Neohortaea acidophila]
MKLEKMIRDGGDRLAILCHWDNLTTNWDLFVEFVSNLPDLMFYLQSRNRAYRIERDGQAQQQLLPRSNTPEYSLIYVNTSELKKGPRPEVYGDGGPDLTTDRGRWQFLRMVMRDTEA